MKTRRRPPVWPLVLGTLALVTLPPAYKVLPYEVARWHLAIAKDHLKDANQLAWDFGKLQDEPDKRQRLRSDRDSALRASEKALEEYAKWGGKTAQYFRTRATIARHRGNGKEMYEYLTSAVLSASPDERWQVFEEISSLEMSRDRLGEAIKYGNLALQSADKAGLSFARPSLLNSVAYARALKGEDLELALKQIDEAIQFLESQRIPRLSEGIDRALLAFYDTRGYTLFRMGRAKDAREQFDEIWETFDDMKGEVLAELQAERIRKIDLRGFESQVAQTKENFAVIAYHRMLVLDPEKDAEEIKKLRSEIRALGYKPGPHLR